MSNNKRTTGYLFDDFTENDFVGKYLNESADICFKKCVYNLKESSLNADEKKCVYNCQAKLYYSYASNFGNLMNNYGGKSLKE